MFKTNEPVIVYPASGTAAWEAALVNTLSPGDRVLMFETGWFSTLWKNMAERLGLKPEIIPGDWRSGVDAAAIEDRLADDRGHAFKAVAVVHNETSTGVTSNIARVREAIDRAGHPALLLVDTISSLASIDYRHDEWGVDVTVGASQKGLMLPPGLSFNAASAKALAASRTARLARYYFDWNDMLQANAKGFFPSTPATNLLMGLRAALDLLFEEGLDNVFRRHARAARATRACVKHWDLEINCRDPEEYSASLTAVRMPEGHSADALRNSILAHSNVSLGNGLGRLSDTVFRIGHLGDFNDPAVIGVLAAVEMGLRDRNVPHKSGGADAAICALSTETPETVADARPGVGCTDSPTKLSVRRTRLHEDRQPESDPAHRAARRRNSEDGARRPLAGGPRSRGASNG